MIDTVYSKETILRKYTQNGRAKPSILQKKRTPQMNGASVFQKKEQNMAPWQSPNFSLQARDVLDAAGRLRREVPL